MRPLRAARRRVDLVVFDPGGRGWSSIIGEQSVIRRVEENSGSGTSLWDEMVNREVPGVSIAVVENNALSWSKGYGHLRNDQPGRVRPDTIYFYYHHGGSNRGFRAYLRGYPERGRGVAVLTNESDNSFPTHIANTVASVLNW